MGIDRSRLRFFPVVYELLGVNIPTNWHHGQYWFIGIALISHTNVWKNRFVQCCSYLHIVLSILRSYLPTQSSKHHQLINDTSPLFLAESTETRSTICRHPTHIFQLGSKISNQWSLTFPILFWQKVQRLKIDLNYVSEHARSLVDIVFVLDASGSIADSEFQQSKTFVKDFLEYFSIAPGHGQVGDISVLYWPVLLTSVSCTR